MNIEILSREKAQTWADPNNGNNLLIRILEPRNGGNFELLNPERFEDVLELYFDDISQESYDDHLRGTNFVIYSDTEAKQVFDFLSNRDEIDNLVIHCHAGISRSSGLGLGIAEHLELDSVVDHIQNSRLYIPNLTVCEVTKYYFYNNNFK